MNKIQKLIEAKKELGKLIFQKKEKYKQLIRAELDYESLGGSIIKQKKNILDIENGETE